MAVPPTAGEHEPGDAASERVERRANITATAERPWWQRVHEVPSLQVHCVACLVQHPSHIQRLHELPEEAAVLLLRGILSKCALTPELVQVFAGSEHEQVLELLGSLNLDVGAGMYVLTDKPPPRQVGDGGSPH